MKEMPLCEWVLEMDAIYFDINPEMGLLQAQQDFQTLVYEHLYAIISFIILFSQYASDYEFYQQFLNNDGVPFRMLAPVFLQQLRIALTARCGHFVECFRRFDEDTAAPKAARSDAEATADKQVATYKRIGKLKTSIMATYNEKRKYGVIPEPHRTLSGRGYQRHLRERRQCSPFINSTRRGCSTAPALPLFSSLGRSQLFRYPGNQAIFWGFEVVFQKKNWGVLA
jgi:hypothetical protein